ncbi:MAG: hypothetical protein GX053_04945, partial [Tissierella sp.]|nr:hypothetical protein [Tissierella sp.]
PLKDAMIHQNKLKSLPNILEDMEKKIILDALNNNKHNISRTAEELGL